MDRIDAILEGYEKDLKKASEGQCKKISRCAEFRESFKTQYREKYMHRLQETMRRLEARGHQAEVKETPPEEVHYGFSLSVVPRHLLDHPFDRFYPLQLRSAISFVANEHTLSVDVEMAVHPRVEKTEASPVEKIPRQQFDEDIMIQKVGVFLERVFNETILLDFRQV